MKITYYFDVMSPYSLLAWQFLKRYQSLWGFELEFVPISLAGIMNVSGNKPPAELKVRGRFQHHDLKRNAELFKYPLLPVPSNYFTSLPIEVMFVQRVLIAALKLNGKQPNTVDINKLMDSFCDAVHSNASMRDSKQEFHFTEEVVATLIEKSGAIQEQQNEVLHELIERAKSKELKEQLKANVEAAAKAGAYGVPSFMISCPEAKIEPFFVFGSDRFEQIASVCKKPYYGASLQLKNNL